MKVKLYYYYYLDFTCHVWWSNNDIKTPLINLSCYFISVSLFVCYILYMLMPKSKYILNYLDQSNQVDGQNPHTRLLKPSRCQDATSRVTTDYDRIDQLPSPIMPICSQVPAQIPQVQDTSYPGRTPNHRHGNSVAEDPPRVGHQRSHHRES